MDEVVAASARPDEAFTWITSVTEGVDPDRLQDANYPYERPMNFGTLDAKLSSAMSRIVTGTFEKRVQVMKTEALGRGRRVSGRQLLKAVDDHFKLTEADGAVFGMEHLLAVTMKNDNLDRFINDWDTVLTGMSKRPEDMVLEAILIRQLKVCSQMKDDVHDFERLAVGDPKRCYGELYRAAKRQVERKRLQTHRDEMTRYIASGNATAVTPKSKGKGSSRPNGKGKGGSRATSKGPGGSEKSENPLKGVCRFHLRGKCRAGDSCSLKHNPRCIFHNKKGGCRLGDKCTFPHNKPTGSGASVSGRQATGDTAQTKAETAPSGSNEASRPNRGRSASRKRGESRSRTETPAVVAALRKQAAFAPSGPENASPAMSVGQWIVDSGSAFDIVSEASLTRKEREQLSDLQFTASLMTANGNTEATKSHVVDIPPAGIMTNAIVLHKSPCVLSLGKRCMEEGFSFRWDAGQQPVLTRPDGAEIVLSVRQNVPLLHPAPACPTAKAETGGSRDPAGAQESTESGQSSADQGASSDDPVKSPNGMPSDDHYILHIPKHPKCDACQRAKSQKRQCRRQRTDDVLLGEGRATKFGEVLTFDHIVTVDPAAMSVEGDANALTIKDLGTGWIECCPTAFKTEDDTVAALQQFVGPKERVELAHTDGADELKLACRAMKWSGWQHPAGLRQMG